MHSTIVFLIVVTVPCVCLVISALFFSTQSPSLLSLRLLLLRPMSPCSRLSRPSTPSNHSTSHPPTCWVARAYFFARKQHHDQTLGHSFIIRCSVFRDERSHNKSEHMQPICIGTRNKQANRGSVLQSVLFFHNRIVRFCK
jgi:hypothetical protein